MTMRNFVVFLFFTFICYSEALLTLPKNQLEFLSNLLQVDINDVKDIASRFAFSTIVQPSDIEIIQYKSDGTSVASELSNIKASQVFELDLKKKIVFIIHGYLSTGNANWVKSMAENYHKIGISNTLAINWNDTAARNYVASAQATKQVGKLVAEWLLNNFNTTLLVNIHLIGHSLGAHVSGFIGKTVNRLGNGSKIGRITGMDPAGPLFEIPIEKSSDQRLCASDAIIVEAYHTNKGMFGYEKPIAQQDFYINEGGPVQPYCFEAWCSHEYSHVIYAETITNSVYYVAKQCNFAFTFEEKECSSEIVVRVGEHNNGTGIEGVFYGYT